MLGFVPIVVLLACVQQQLQSTPYCGRTQLLLVVVEVVLVFFFFFCVLLEF